MAPAEPGAALFVDADYHRLDTGEGPFQLAVYGPCPLSPGELALLRSRFETNLFEYAARAAVHGRAWKRQAVLAALELGILGLLVSFMILNPSGLHFLIGWALPLGFFGATLGFLRAFARRGVGRRARRLLENGVVLAAPGIGRAGESAACVRDLWRAVDRGAVTRDAVSLEQAARSQLHWPAGAAFYRSLRRSVPAEAPQGWQRRLARALVGAAPAGAATYIAARAP